MLTRIYGLAFQTKKELEDHLKQLAEAEKRNHRKLGQKLDLFSADKSFELAIDLAQKKYKLVKNLSRDKIYSRVVGFLLRRGFSYDEAKKAYNLIQNP